MAGIISMISRGNLDIKPNASLVFMDTSFIVIATYAAMFKFAFRSACNDAAGVTLILKCCQNSYLNTFSFSPKHKSETDKN